MADFSYTSRQQNDVKTERTRIFNICYEKNTNKLETVSIAEPLQNRQHAPLMLSTLGSKEKRERG